MAQHFHRTVNPEYYPAGGGEPGSSASAVAWPAVWAGAVVAIAVTLILLTLGSGFGLAALSPWPGVGPKPTSFAIGTGIWIIVTQWISALFGGYIAGRTRTRWNFLHSDEVFFRDTAHGLLTWALATIAMTAVAALTASLAADVPVSTDVEVTRAAADAARKVAATYAIFGAVSLIIGAFIACVSAAYGGHLRDEHP